MNPGPLVLAVVIMAAAFWVSLATCAAAAPQSDREALRLINSINRQANVEIPQGTPWNDGRDGIWNCEEVAGLKLSRLAAAGYPHQVRSYRVTTPWGEAHAVLEVELPSGRAVVLDSLSPWTMTRDQTGHTDWRATYIQRR